MAQTVVVTGASGYIAKHIVARLLDAGYRVRGTVRKPGKGEEIAAAVRPRLADPAAIEALSFATLDLARDEGWDGALAGADILMHTASPFPIVQPDNAEELIRPAVDGTLRALRAARAAGVGRVVMTSSSVAVMEGHRAPARAPYDETVWSDPEGPGINAYGKSKTLAERAAWDFVAKEGQGMALTVINPAFVVGAPLDRDYGTSIQVVERIVRGSDPMLPNFGFPCVDVGDIAEMHVRALTRDGTAGERFIGAERFLWLPEMARLIKAAMPERRISTRVAPDLVVRMLGLFDRSIRGIVPILGKREELSAAKAERVLGIRFRDTRESVVETARALVALGAVR